MHFKWIKALTIVIAVLALAIKLYYLWRFYSNTFHEKDYSTLKLIGINVQFVTDITLPVIVILIVRKSLNERAFYLALALAMFSVATSIPLSYDLPLYIVGSLISILTGCMYIFSMQYFPVTVTAMKIDSSICWRWLNLLLKKLLNVRVFWIVLPLLMSLISCVEYLFKGAESVNTMLILSTAFTYLYINFRTTKGVDHASILWLFWGMAMYILMHLVYYSLYLYGGEPGETVRVLISIILLLILFVSFSMSLFFANTFNTGVFVTRSVVNAVLFVLIVFIYNTIEHYVLHWISHQLHISDAVVASMLSGVLVLFIAPLHHRLTTFLNRKLKGGQHQPVHHGHTSSAV